MYSSLNATDGGIMFSTRKDEVQYPTSDIFKKRTFSEGTEVANKKSRITSAKVPPALSVAEACDPNESSSFTSPLSTSSSSSSSSTSSSGSSLAQSFFTPISSITQATAALAEKLYDCAFALYHSLDSQIDDEAVAITLFTKAAKRNHLKAILFLANYYEGIDPISLQPRDVSQALLYYSRVVEINIGLAKIFELQQRMERLKRDYKFSPTALFPSYPAATSSLALPPITFFLSMPHSRSAKSAPIVNTQESKTNTTVSICSAEPSAPAKGS